MNKSKAKKIQHLLTTHLMSFGSIQLLLPDGVTLDIDITEVGKHGVEIADDYCCVRASRDGNAALLDTYSLGLEYQGNGKTIMCMDSDFDQNGRTVKRLEVV
jgi:hypothetical protein